MSQVYHKYKVCYLSIDKCATGNLGRFLSRKAFIPNDRGKIDIMNPPNLSRVIEPYDGKETGQTQVKASYIKKLYPKYFLFTFIRNPYNRAVLPYRHRGGIKIGPTKRLRPQTWYIDIPLSKFDFIGKIENLHEDFDKLRKFFSFKGYPTEDNIHKSHGKHDYRRYYTDATLKLMNTVYAEDFKILPYDMQTSLPLEI